MFEKKSPQSITETINFTEQLMNILFEVSQEYIDKKFRIEP
jgi:hypothetical protein